MSTLISHSGAVEVTHDQLNRLEEPKPLTETHTPIHHGRFVSLVKQEIEKQGFEIIREEFSLRQGAPEMAPNGFRATNGFDDLFLNIFVEFIFDSLFDFLLDLLLDFLFDLVTKI